jgi:hypothetical protein
MKTTTLLIGLLLSGIFLSAQYNFTYDNNSAPDYQYHGRVIETSDQGNVFISMNYDGVNSIWYAVATKVDQFGGPVWNKRIMPYDPSIEGIFNTAALIETDDKGILIAGFFYRQGDITNAPISVKLDSNGNFVWSHIYNVDPNFIVTLNQNKISLARVEDDDEENYFIVANASSDYSIQDNVVNVIKINIGGDMIWSKKYYDVNWASSGFSAVRDIPGDIAFSPVDNLYMITGRREQWIWGPTSEMFFFGIDRDGNLMTQFKSITTPGYPFGQDMVFNKAVNQFAVTYCHGNTSYSGNPCVASGIGLVTIDAALNISVANFYWPFTEGYENYGQSISISQDYKYYIIGCFNYKSDCGLPGYRTPALMKVDYMGNPIWYARYNIKDDAVFGAGASITATGPNGQEEYVMVAENNTDSRVIRTDINGYTCGVEYDHFSYLPYSWNKTIYNYYWEESGEALDYKPDVYDEHIPYRKCDSSTNWEYYSAEETASGSNTIAISGTHQLSSNSSEINIKNESTATSTVEIYNIAGTLVMQGQIAAGARTVPLKSANLSTGMYIIRFKDTNGKLISADKVMVTD